MKFKSNTGKETLEKDGFEVREFEHYLINLKDTYLEDIAARAKSQDVFRTKLGDIKQIQNMQDHPDFKYEFANLNKMIARCFDFEDYKVLNNQYFCKPPNYKMTSPHQDNAYFESEEDVFTFWIPLQDVDLINSCMFYVPGSHKKGLVEHKAIGTNTRTRNGKTGVSMYSDYYRNSEFVKVPMKVGEILAHDKNTMHFSSPNLSDNYRISITSILKIIK